MMDARVTIERLHEVEEFLRHQRRAARFLVIVRTLIEEFEEVALGE